MPFRRSAFRALTLLAAGASICLSACSSDFSQSPPFAVMPMPTPNPVQTPWPERPYPTLTRHPQLQILQDSSAAYPETCPSSDSGCQTRHELAKIHQCLQTDAEGKAKDLIDPNNGFGAGLTPALPIAVCTYVEQSAGSAPEAVIFSWSESWPYTKHFVTWYLVRTSAGVIKLSKEADFRQQFAPVESPAEALAFVQALKQHTYKLDKRYLDQLTLSRTRFVAATAEETRVEADGDNWKVLNVMQESPCGQLIERLDLGAVPGYAVDYRVGRDGKISEIAKRLIFVDIHCPYI